MSTATEPSEAAAVTHADSARQLEWALRTAIKVRTTQKAIYEYAQSQLYPIYKYHCGESRGAYFGAEDIHAEFSRPR